MEHKNKSYLDNVLVVYKTSLLRENEIARYDYAPSITQSLPIETSKAIIKSHRENSEAISTITDALERYGVQYTLSERRNLDKVKVKKFNQFSLIITAGGDGSVLMAARHLTGTPLMGINSSPNFSIGHLCIGDFETSDRYIGQLKKNRLQPKRLNRIQVSIDDLTIEDLALNEVLISHKDPAAVSKYKIQIGRSSEIHKSSGIWICTAAGSTGAAKSAGGSRLALQDTHFQYVTRELYSYNDSNYRLIKGIISCEQTITITSLMQEGIISFDGHHRVYPFYFGNDIKITLTGTPLKIFL